MRSLLRFVPFSLLFAVALWGCDSTGPSEPASLSSGGEYEEAYEIAGSVFINSHGTDAEDRNPIELGIAQVRVDLLYTPKDEYYQFEEGDSLSVYTDIDGYYTATVPKSGMWTVRVTSEPSVNSEESFDAFNPTLFSAYDPASDTEHIVTVGEIVINLDGESDAEANFSFLPDFAAILQDLTQGPFVTDAKPLREWRRMARHAADPRNDCPNQRNWVCRDEIGVALAKIFSGDGDDFFGNEDPFVLGANEDPFKVAVEILDARPKTEDDQLLQQLFLAELNYFTGFGSPDPNYDRTVLRYLEVFVASQGVDAARTESLSQARVVVSPQLELALAYNRGGGGGGQVGD